MVLSSGFVSSTVDSQAEEIKPHFPASMQELRLTAGYLLPHRLTKDHVTKQEGPALMPLWEMVLHELVGDGWYQGQTTVGAKAVCIEFREPVLTHGVGFTPESNTRASHSIACGLMSSSPAARSGTTWADAFPKSRLGSTSS